MSEALFQERFLELPAFKRVMDILIRFVPAEEHVLAEIATILMMAQEDCYNWGTLCQNCGVLMDDNYAKHVEIEQLREDLAFLRAKVEGLQEDLAYAENEIRSYDRFDF